MQFLVLSTFCFAVAGFLIALPLFEFWDSFSKKYLGDLYTTSVMLGLDQTYYTLYLRLWGGVMVINFLVFGIFFQVWPIMLALLYLIFVAPRLIMEYLVTRRKRLIRDQLIPALSVIANGTKAGLALEESFREATLTVPAPLNREFRQIVRDHHLGRPFIASINLAKERLDVPCFTLFATALTVSREQGGNLSDVLERLRKSLVETQRLERKLEADTASGNMVIFVLSLVPFFFTLMILVMHPSGGTLLFTTLLGQFLFSLVMIMTYLGNRWGQHIMKIEF